MESQIEVAVYMPDAEAAKWLLFQQHYEPISLLIERDVFVQKNCEIALHFDHEGTLQAIKRHDVLYSRRHV